MPTYYGNRQTKVLHKSKQDDACRASEIKKENRVRYDSTESAKGDGFRLCKICFKGLCFKD